MDRCIAITGAGKSGSKRLLKILDLSPMTHCRCEPNELLGSHFAALPSGQMLHPGIDEQMDALWDRAVSVAARCMGICDSLPCPPKYHHWPLARRLQLWRIVKHGKLRQALSIVVPSLRGAEWPLPWWLVSRQRLAEALPVLKIGLAAGWVPWLLQHREQTKVINIVRHPAGFLHSYIGRWLSCIDIDQTAALNRARLHTIAQFNPGWAGTADQIDRMSCVESELWYWRYFYETVHAAGCDNENYLLVRDEDIVADPIGAAKRIYQFAGLDWCASAETYLDQVADHWQSRVAPWRQLLEDEHIELVERVLAGSRMQNWWDPQQTVSRFDYVAY